MHTLGNCTDTEDEAVAFAEHELDSVSVVGGSHFYCIGHGASGLNLHDGLDISWSAIRLFLILFFFFLFIHEAGALICAAGSAVSCISHVLCVHLSR